MWDSASDGHYKTYLPCQRLIRIFADLNDRDPLGGVWLRHPRTLAEIETQHLLMRPGVYVVVHDERDGVYAHLESALDEAGDLVPMHWWRVRWRRQKSSSCAPMGPRRPLGGIPIPRQFPGALQITQSSCRPHTPDRLFSTTTVGGFSCSAASATRRCPSNSKSPVPMSSCSG
jgi:hypothetical protein